MSKIKNEFHDEICDKASREAGEVPHLETDFEKELSDLINRHSKENGSNTPDFILAEYLSGCLKVYEKTIADREAHRGVDINVKRATAA